MTIITPSVGETIEFQTYAATDTATYTGVVKAVGDYDVARLSGFDVVSYHTKVVQSGLTTIGNATDADAVYLVIKLTSQSALIAMNVKWINEAAYAVKNVGSTYRFDIGNTTETSDAVAKRIRALGYTVSLVS